MKLIQKQEKDLYKDSDWRYITWKGERANGSIFQGRINVVNTALIIGVIWMAVALW